MQLWDAACMALAVRGTPRERVELMEPKPRRFRLNRHRDISTISGTGIVAEGIQFTDGKVAMRWMVGDHKSTVVHESITAVQAIHGHGGATEIQWLDP